MRERTDNNVFLRRFCFLEPNLDPSEVAILLLLWLIPPLELELVKVQIQEPSAIPQFPAGWMHESLYRKKINSVSRSCPEEK